MIRALLIAAVVVTAACGTAAPVSIQSPAPALSPDPEKTERPAAGATPTPALASPITADLPTGKPAPLQSSAPLRPTRAPKTPQPTPDPETWRLEGLVTDEAGAPLEDVCVVFGPRGCQKVSPHTDERGVYFLDVAIGRSIFDISYEKAGYATEWVRIQPTGPTVFNVTLKRG